MNTHANKSQENSRQSSAIKVSQKQKNEKSTIQIIDNRPETIVQRKLQVMADNSPRIAEKNMYGTIHPNNTVQRQVIVPSIIQKKGGNKEADYKYGKLNSDTHVHAFNKQGGHVKLMGNVFKYGTEGDQMEEAEAFFRENEKALQQKCKPSDYNGLWKWIKDWQ